MHLTRPSYRGSSAFRASRLSPRMIMFSLPLSSLCCPFSSKRTCAPTPETARPDGDWSPCFFQSIQVLAWLISSVIVLSSFQMRVFLPWPSAVMRVTSGYVCIAVIVVKDLSCGGRTNFLSNAVIVCRIDDLGRFVTRGQCAHSHPRGGNRPHYFESESLI